MQKYFHNIHVHYRNESKKSESALFSYNNTVIISLAITKRISADYMAPVLGLISADSADTIVIAMRATIINRFTPRLIISTMVSIL